MFELTQLLPRCLGDMNVQDLDDEWRFLSLYNLPTEINSRLDVDHFWGKLLKLENENGKRLFRNIARFVLNILSIPHSNADCERTFSKVNNIKTESRNCLANETTTAILLAKQHVKEVGGCCAFEPTKSMLNKFNKNMYAKVTADEDTSAEATIAV